MFDIIKTIFLTLVLVIIFITLLFSIIVTSFIEGDKYSCTSDMWTGCVLEQQKRN